jgi:hypothetical protein
MDEYGRLVVPQLRDVGRIEHDAQCNIFEIANSKMESDHPIRLRNLNDESWRLDK